jgi:heme-degrading monooxygenase HmoA
MEYDPMIARVWRGVTSDSEKADRYVEHVNKNVVPQLANIRGHINIKVLRRDLKDEVEVLVITTWESIEAVKGFAGTDIDNAVVEPQAIAVLKDYERTVRHFEIAIDTP